MRTETILSSALCLLPFLSGAQTAQKPNVLLILADDMRGTTVHAAGVEETYTPCLDALPRRIGSGRYALYERPHYGGNFRSRQYAQPGDADDR